MKRKVTKKGEPSKASLAEMPEIDASRFSGAVRGRHAARARRSLEVIVVDKKTVAKLGGATAILRILQALAESLEPRRKKGHAA